MLFFNMNDQSLNTLSTAGLESVFECFLISQLHISFTTFDEHNVYDL